MTYTLSELDYDYNALEPAIDEETLRIHHTRHHQGYVDKFNKAVEGTGWEGNDPEDIFPEISKVPDAIARNAGQVYNHHRFWKSMTPDAKEKPEGDLLAAIESEFGRFENFKKTFADAAANQFGSGWAWLIKDGDQLAVIATPNHINPLMDLAERKGEPLLCIDVWEHAYYLKYQNKRADFIEAFWGVVNWDEASRQFEK